MAKKLCPLPYGGMYTFTKFVGALALSRYGYRQAELMSLVCAEKRLN